ncbi:hypothetical protein BU17DRAFT_71888 [Hysterangium stoloniferum]|nr:hypothetical protein BU17DRAFT_71888 [Hysterangium stoloniferum]
MGMLARLSLKEACVVLKPASSTSSSSSTIKSEGCSEAKLKRATTYDEDDFEQNSNLQPTKDLLLRQIISRPRACCQPPTEGSWERAVPHPLFSRVAIYERDLFLFTAVLAISSRHLPLLPKTPQIAMNLPEYAAATAFIDGVKSVEMGEDRSWLYGARHRVKQTLQRCKGGHEIDEPATAGHGRVQEAV